MSRVRWLDDVEMQAWRGFLRAHSRVLDRLDHELQAAQQLSVADYGVLVTLSEAEDHRLRMTELAERLDLSPSGLTRRIDRLVDAGLVQRVRCPEDRRGSYAVLARRGLTRLEEAAPDHVDQVRRHFVDRLDRDELATLASAFAMLAAEPVEA
jgi:DNA-binding MarR family transcriptional regulator